MVATIIPGKHSYLPLISPTGSSTIISIIFFDSALTPSINKDHLSNFDSNNSPSISLFVDSVLEPLQLQKGYPSSILHVDPSVIPSFNLNPDPNQQPDTIQCVLTTIVISIIPDFHPTSSICSSFSNIFKLQFIFFLKHLNMDKSLFYLGIPLLN